MSTRKETLIHSKDNPHLCSSRSLTCHQFGDTHPQITTLSWIGEQILLLRISSVTSKHVLQQGYPQDMKMEIGEPNRSKIDVTDRLRVCRLYEQKQ